MNCKEARQLISPYLDGVLESKETLLLQRHLELCPECGRIYREQARLSEVLRSMGKDIKPAPSGFKDAVMRAVEEESHKTLGFKRWSKWVGSSWKKMVPAVAAAVFLVFASLNWLTPDNPAIQGNYAVQDEGPVEPTPTDIIVEPAEIVAPDTIIEETPEAPPATVKPEDPKSPIIVAENPPDDPPLTAAGPAGSVLLSVENRNILTTMLHIQSQRDQDLLAEQVLSIAARSGGSVEKLGQEVKEGVNYNLFKITVDRNQNNAVLDRLGSLGFLIKRDEDRRDISQAYTQALEQFLRLSNLRSESKDPAEIKQLELQLTSLQKQLNDWKQEASTATIVLCVQDDY